MANKTIKIRYLKSHDFRPMFVTGVYGGVQSSGLINADFFVDRIIIPESQEVEVNEHHMIVGKGRESKDGDIAREIQCSVIMDANTAKQIVEWLQTRIDEIESHSKK